MEVIAVVAVVVAVAALALVLVNQRRAVGPPMPVAPVEMQPAVDTAALRAEMSNEVSRTVAEAVNASLATAMHQLSERARLDREESIKMAAEKIAASGGEQLGTKAQVIDTTLRQPPN